jgi:RimJ/RimL family protein N-acetyltransferase
VLTPLPRDSRAVLRPLFEGFTGLHGVIDSVIEGVLGEAYADDPGYPRVGRICLDFNAIAGDPEAPAAAELLASLPAGEHVVVPEAWENLLVEVRGDGLQPYDRFLYRAPGEWDRGRLAAVRRAIPEGLSLEPITEESVAEFAKLADSLVYNFDTYDDFLSRGVGFGIRARAGGEFIAGCSSFAISSRSLEIEIQTHAAYQRRGLALVTGSRMIEYCIEKGLEACWDAAHEGSARLAERLGFVAGQRYTAYRLA